MQQRLHRLLLLRSLGETAWLVAFIVACSLIIGVVTYRTAVVEGESMEPAIRNGEELLINLHAYDRSWPARGDVVVFSYPQDPTREFIKRVIAMPGETVQIRQGQVLVNGQPLPEPYHPTLEATDFGPVSTPPNTVFVLGDNRPHSSDSRLWGPLAVRRIHGRAQYVIWPPTEVAVIR